MYGESNGRHYADHPQYAHYHDGIQQADQIAAAAYPYSKYQDPEW